MDILKKAASFEAMAQKKPSKHNPLVPPPEKTFTEEDALGRPIVSDEEIEQGLRSFDTDEKKIERTMGLLVPATISSLEHAVKMATKSGEALRKGNKAQAKMYASIAFETLRDVLERLEK